MQKLWLPAVIFLCIALPLLWAFDGSKQNTSATQTLETISSETTYPKDYFMPRL